MARDGYDDSQRRRRTIISVVTIGLLVLFALIALVSFNVARSLAEAPAGLPVAAVTEA